MAPTLVNGLDRVCAYAAPGCHTENLLLQVWVLHYRFMEWTENIEIRSYKSLAVWHLTPWPNWHVAMLHLMLIWSRCQVQLKLALYGIRTLNQELLTLKPCSYKLRNKITGSFQQVEPTIFCWWIIIHCFVVLFLIASLPLERAPEFS